MPASSRVLRFPNLFYEFRGAEYTTHKRTRCRRPAAKDRQRDSDVAHALITLDAIPQDGGHKFRSQAQPLLQEVAFALGQKSAESACRLLHRPGRSFIEVKATKHRLSYRMGIPEKGAASRTYEKQYFQAPSAREAVKNAELAEFLGNDVNKLSKVNFVKFFEITHHRLSPLNRTDRAVYDFLCESGLYLQDKSGKRWKSGSVQLTQEFIGSRIGRHRDTVRRSLRRMALEWTDRPPKDSGRLPTTYKGMGLFKMIGKPGAWMKYGKPVPKGTEGAVWQQDESNEYIGICEWAETEKERYDRAMEAIRATRSEWAKVMDPIFAQTRLEWLEEGKQLKTFQQECCRRMAEAGIPEKILERVFPRPPD